MDFFGTSRLRFALASDLGAKGEDDGIDVAQELSTEIFAAEVLASDAERPVAEGVAEIKRMLGRLDEDGWGGVGAAGGRDDLVIVLRILQRCFVYRK